MACKWFWILYNTGDIYKTNSIFWWFCYIWT